MSVTIVGTVPTTRKSQANLPLNEIDSIKLFRNGIELDSLVPTSTTFTFKDLTPLTGADDYTVRVLTKDGFISDESNVASVSIVGADPASAVTDLSASVDAPSTARRK